MTQPAALIKLSFVMIVTLAGASCARAMSDVRVTPLNRPPVRAALVAQPSAQEPSASNAPLAMDLSAYMVSEPAHVDVRMRIGPDARSRWVTVAWWSADGVGGSQGPRSPVRNG